MGIRLNGWVSSTTRPRVPAVMLVLLAIASVQWGSSTAKGLYDLATPLNVVWLRLLGAGLALLLVARPRLTGRPAADWALVTGYGLVLATMNFTFYLAIERIPIGMAVTLEFLGPLGVALGASRRARDLLWVALAAIGVALLGVTPGDLDLVGVAFALVAGACWAAYIVLGVPVGRRWSGVTGVTVGSWVGFAALSVVVLVAGTPLSIAPTVVGLGLLVGVLSSAIPYGLEMVALRRIPRGTFGVLMSLEPAAAAFFALLLLGEQLRPVEVVAMACVIVASIGATRGSRPEPTPLD